MGSAPIANGLLHVIQFTCEEMIGFFNPYNLFRRGSSGDCYFDLGSGTVLVPCSADEELWFAAGGEKVVAVIAAFSVNR